jgi:aspartate/methionine/tyrosine aminotransferase
MDRTDIAAFWFGESDLPTPDFIREAAVRALEGAETFYTQNLGRPALREAIAAYAGGLHGRAVEAARVAVTGSGVSALMLASQLVVAPGERVVVVTPIWPNIAEIPALLGAEVVRFPLSVSGGRWQLDLERLLAALTPQTRMLVVNSPNNPTGWTIEPEAQRELLEHCRRHGIWVLSDEGHRGLVRVPEADGAMPSSASSSWRSGFGPEGEGYLRWCFAAAEAKIARACRCAGYSVDRVVGVRGPAGRCERHHGDAVLDRADVDAEIAADALVVHHLEVPLAVLFIS